MNEPKKYENPLLEWAMHGNGNAPSKEEAKSLLIGLRESLLKSENLIINARHTLDAAESLRKRLEVGIKRTEEVANG